MKQFLGRHFEIAGTGERVLPMEGLRALAALLVFFVHFYALFHPYIADGSWALVVFGTAGAFGHTGVDLFFVLSGFLIYGILFEKNPKYENFIRRRARRLYPVFLAVFGMYLVLSLVFPGESRLPHGLSKLLAYIAANLLMLPGMTSITPMITVAWSLSYEWFFYLAMPLLIAALALRRWSSGRRIALFLLLPSLYFVLVSFGIVGRVRLVLFAAGIVIWELVDRGGLHRLKAWAEYLVAAAFLINILAIGLAGWQRGDSGLVLLDIPWWYTPSLFVTLLPFCLYSMFYSGFLQRLFSHDYLRWMGNISYSYYLIHGLALHGMRLLVNRLFPPAPRSSIFDVLLLMACLSFSIICAALLYLVVEKPLSWSAHARRPRSVTVSDVSPAGLTPAPEASAEASASLEAGQVRAASSN